MKRRLLLVFYVVLLTSFLVTTVLADDGLMFRKNVSKTPELETEHAALKMLPMYVVPQQSDGTVLTEGIDYLNVDGTLVETLLEVQPLVAMYVDGHAEGIEEEGYGGFPGHGERDAFAAVSLDDGATWNRSNLSQSADLSSFTIIDPKGKQKAYPGDVGRTALASDGDQILAVWVSRYASGGSPNYAMADTEREAVAGYLGLGTECTDGDLITTPCLYLEDHFGVSGSQGSSDLADEGFPLIGELPYAAVWVARGVIVPPAVEGEETSIVWFKAERLSSATRDANRPEASCAKGAGCVITWQEDPDGMRPGEGEGPGEGWSGAIAHHQTDTWYSYIDWDDFSLVSEDGTYGALYGDTGDLAEWVTATTEGRPQAAIPMSIPVRLTDNAMCTLTSTAPFCHADFDGSGTADFCASTVPVSIETPEGPTQTVDMCVTEDGRLMRGNTASTRARVSLHEYSTTEDFSFAENADNSAFFDNIDSAWFSMSYEENKGLGECDDVDATKLDMGKNVWYHTFDMFSPELVSQGLMLNQPAVYPADFSDPLGVLTQDTSLGGYNFYQITEDPIYETLASLESTLYQTEISRRPSPITQDFYKAGTTGTVAFQLWKQGVVRRGGPADIMGRTFTIPDDFDSKVDNPYGYANMTCVTTAFTDGLNPRYVKGFCADPATNLSANTILLGESCSDATTCLDVFPFNDYFDDLEGGLPISKIHEWQQFGPGFGIDPATLVGTDINADDTNLNDSSWANPYDVSKGHRGFLNGDMLMVMYAWSPNWQANTVGHDNYNLYARRSFDGGQTWSTTPSSFVHTDGETYSGNGTTTCEWMGPAGSTTEYPVCTPYAAGEFEQARNVSQLVGNRETILDPRYSPTPPTLGEDIKDPSRFFMVYETGDNTTVAEGEAEPLDLFYSRAVEWGDHYLVWAEDDSTCLPSTGDNTALTGFCNEFDALEGSARSESGEASITTNPSGTRFYAVWNQVDFDRNHNEIGSDAWFRRVLFIDDYPVDPPTTGTGGNKPTVAIFDPLDGDVFADGDVVEFFAMADDEEDGILDEAIVWTSSIDGEIGIGSVITAELTSGDHLITATVTDTSLLTELATVSITVGNFGGGDPPQAGPHIEARLSEGLIEGFGWVLDGFVEAKVNGEVIGVAKVDPALWDTSISYVSFEHEIEPGDVIAFAQEYDDGEEIVIITTEHIVTDIEIIEVDLELDRVIGKAEAGSNVAVWACTKNECSDTLLAKANDDGFWMANFVSFDIEEGNRIDAGQQDEMGNLTIFGYEAMEPILPYQLPEDYKPRWYLNNSYGRLVTDLIAGQDQQNPAGKVRIYNNGAQMLIETTAENDWLIKELHIYAGAEPVTTKKGNPIPGIFPYGAEFAVPSDIYLLTIDLAEEFDFAWGEPFDALRQQNVAVHAVMVKLNDFGGIEAEEGAWAFGPYEFEGDEWGWWTTYELMHPRTGHFIDSPVGGLIYDTATHFGKTDASGAFYYFPGETVALSIGTHSLGVAIADHKISPLDIYENADIEDPRVINMARLLQSLDADADPKPGIDISDDVVACLDTAMAGLGLAAFDFADDAQIEGIIQGTISACAGTVELVSVSAEDAQANLDRALSTTMFRKNVSRSPALTSSKSKLNIMGVWFPARRANDELSPVEYYDETGTLIRTEENAKPIVVTYTDGVDETGYEDIFAGISRDDGNTFKRMNLSRAADRTSFTLANGQEYYGQAKKPVFHVKGNNILIAWTSKYCKGGKPAYAIDPEDDYPYDDPYYTEDIWGVAGPQRSVDYTEQGYPEVGEVPYSCVWVARGTVVTQGMINSGGFWADKLVGEIVWFKPERLTSGRRDANQVFMGGADGAGFAIAWQEDPEGLRPGDASGPGPGWGGATTNHKTDIWYSYITMADFRKIDANFVSGGDPEHEIDVTGRPKALVPMSLPVRVTDNDVVNSDNIMATTTDFATWTPVPNPNTLSDGDGTHAYGYTIDGLCEGWYEKVNEQEETKEVCITADGRLLDGDTGASRPNLFLQTYTKPDGTKSAYAIFAYEETKGMGDGSPDHEADGPYGDDYVAEEGKNAMYHSFDFQNPDLVSAGNIINLPEKEVDADGNILSDISYVKDEEGNLILDYLDQAQIAYENARRPRFILQGKGAVGSTKTVMLVLYKEGLEGHGRPSDIMMRRVVAAAPGNPYAFSNFICNATEVALNGVEVCVDGAMNMSSVTPIETTDSMGDPNVDDPYGAVKVVRWEQTPENLADLSLTNPYDDARAHRGQIRGDFVVMGFSYTPNWAASRNGNDKYDFFVRRSFDGGQTWTTDPTGDGVTHCNTWTDPVTKEKTEACNTYIAGEFEQMHNLSQLPNNKTTVIEPRIVAPPGTIKKDGVWTGIAEDKQNKNVFYVSYGTSTNPKKDPVTGEQEAPHPLDLFYSFSQDKGESYVLVQWDVNPDSDGNYAGETIERWDYIAKGDPEQGEAQLRMTPDGSRFYITWLQEGVEGSDIWFRRIMSPAFTVNVAQ